MKDFDLEKAGVKLDFGAKILAFIAAIFVAVFHGVQLKRLFNKKAKIEIQEVEVLGPDDVQ